MDCSSWDEFSLLFQKNETCSDWGKVGDCAVGLSEPGARNSGPD